jgi:hypothetical protein
MLMVSRDMCVMAGYIIKGLKIIIKHIFHSIQVLFNKPFWYNGNWLRYLFFLISNKILIIDYFNKSIYWKRLIALEYNKNDNLYNIDSKLSTKYLIPEYLFFITLFSFL